MDDSWETTDVTEGIRFRLNKLTMTINSSKDKDSLTFEPPESPRIVSKDVVRGSHISVEPHYTVNVCASNCSVSPKLSSRWKLDVELAEANRTFTIWVNDLTEAATKVHVMARRYAIASPKRPNPKTRPHFTLGTVTVHNKRSGDEAKWLATNLKRKFEERR